MLILSGSLANMEFSSWPSLGGGALDIFPWTGGEPGLEGPALLGKMQALSRQLCLGGVASAQKQTCQASLEKNNNKHLVLRVKPGEQSFGDDNFIRSKSSSLSTNT